MRRFYFKHKDRRADEVILDDDESRHIGRVLRLTSGEKIELSDGLGSVYLAEILGVSGNVKVRIISEKCVEENSAKLQVGQALIKSKKMELVLQKCTELGVDSFFPFISSRCQRNLIQQYQGKGERQRRIIEEACKQCLRPTPMILNDIISLGDILKNYETEDNILKLLFWEKEKAISLSSLSDALKENHTALLLFGPEGGFTEEEVATAVHSGWQTVSLGKRVLRAETAVIAATSIAQHYFGNM